jgi:hypothetical protein
MKTRTPIPSPTPTFSDPTSSAHLHIPVHTSNSNTTPSKIKTKIKSPYIPFPLFYPGFRPVISLICYNHPKYNSPFTIDIRRIHIPPQTIIPLRSLVPDRSTHYYYTPVPSNAPRDPCPFAFSSGPDQGWSVSKSYPVGIDARQT